MKILIKKATDLLSKKLTITERGILITLFLIQEKDTSMTLAKAKSQINFTSHKVDLIRLHEMCYIEWSEYEKVKRTLDKQEEFAEIALILEFMSNLYGRKFSVVPKRITLLGAILEHYTIEDVKLVISNRWLEWKDNPVMKIHLKPDTIFRFNHFQKYLEEAQFTQKGSSIIEVQKIGLQKGDVITFENSKTFIDTEYYDYLVYALDSKGRTGIPRKECRLGKDLKMNMKIRNQMESLGQKMNEEYVYNPE